METFSVLPVLLLAWPLISTADEIKPYEAREAQSHTAQQIQPYKTKEIESGKAKALQSHQAREVQPYQTKEVQRNRGSGQPRVFTKEEREMMHRNDVKAGRTPESMSKNTSTEQGVNRNGYSDPYNTGGWNNNTNQSASPIWNPNSQ